MAVLEVLVAWFLLSLTGALAPGPLSAAVVMQASRRGKLHGILPMLGHAIVELGIITAIILSVQALMFDQFLINAMVFLGGIVIILFGFLALRDYRYTRESSPEAKEMESSLTTKLEATLQGATVSILSPYFLLWWFGIGLANVTLLMGQLQVGAEMVFFAGLLIYLTHISTDFIYGAVLTVSSDEVSKRAKVGGVNWLNIAIGVFQIVLGILFVLQVFVT